VLGWLRRLFRPVGPISSLSCCAAGTAIAATPQGVSCGDATESAGERGQRDCSWGPGLVANLLLAPDPAGLPLPWEVIFREALAAVLQQTVFLVDGAGLQTWPRCTDRTPAAPVQPASTDALAGGPKGSVENPQRQDPFFAGGGGTPPETPKARGFLNFFPNDWPGIPWPARFGLLEGQVIVAQAVIDELQTQLADVQQQRKKRKGRRGLNLAGGCCGEGRYRPAALVVNRPATSGCGPTNKLAQAGPADTAGTLPPPPITTWPRMAESAGTQR